MFDGFSGQLFRIFEIIFVLLYCSVSDLVICVGYISPSLNANSIWKSFSLNISDARETANCSITGITHNYIRKDFQMLLAVNARHV